MKNLLLYISTIPLFLLANKNVVAQTTTAQDTNFVAEDTSNITRRFTISEPDFDSLVYRYVGIMEKGAAIKNINDNITVFRLFNTLDWAPAIPDKAAYSRLKYLFGHQYSAPVLHKLNPIMRNGGDGLYSFFLNADFSRLKRGHTRVGFYQKAYYHVIFKGFNPGDTGNIARRLIISEQDFDLQINKFLDIKKKGDTLKTVNDCIILARLINTLEFNSEQQKKETGKYDEAALKRFNDLFYYYYDQIIHKLHCVRRKGGEGWYSFYYGVGIGFSSFFVDERDYYHIVSK